MRAAIEAFVRVQLARKSASNTPSARRAKRPRSASPRPIDTAREG